MLWRIARQLPLSQRKFTPLPAIVRRSFSKGHVVNRNIASVLDAARSGSQPFERTVEVSGHVRTIRNQKRLSFAKIGDGSTTEDLQVILEPVQAKG